MGTRGGFGCELEVDRGAGFFSIGNIRVVGAPKPKVETADSTCHDAEGGFLTKLQTGRIDPGSMGFETLHDRDLELHAALIGATVNPPTPPWSYRLWLPSGDGYEFDAIVEQYAPDPKQAEPLAYSGTLQITGPVEPLQRTPNGE